MKHLLLVLGLVAMPTKQKNSLPLPQPLTPYIHASIPNTIPSPILLQNPPKTLIDAMIFVESSGNSRAYNKKERACGCLQIRPIMLREINRILRKQNIDKKFTLEDRWKCEKSKEMFYIWVNYYHESSTNEIIARNWNGGPKGYKKTKTVPYWNKVKEQLKWEN